MSKEKYLLEERRFLHSIATPLSTVFFLLDLMNERLNEEPEKNAEQLKMVASSIKALKDARQLMQQRREEIIEEQNREKKAS